MSVQPDESWTESGEPIRIRLDLATDYSGLTDEQLLDERDSQRKQLEELTMHPGTSPAVLQLRSSIEREVGRMTDELRRRHPSRESTSARGRHRLRLRRATTGSSSD
jgi:hypothetical protein